MLEFYINKESFENSKFIKQKVYVLFKRLQETFINSYKQIKVMIKENLLIKENNLLALKCLEEAYSKKIKLIYIDPPYNTGGDANIFTYNNSFNHSVWLTFIKNRLEVAKNLLSER